MERLPFCMVHLDAGAGSVKQKYDKPLDYVHCIIGDLLWPIYKQASIVHLSVPAVTSMLTMLSSFHVQQSLIQCHSMSKHGILVGHMTSLV